MLNLGSICLNNCINLVNNKKSSNCYPQKNNLSGLNSDLVCFSGVKKTSNISFGYEIPNISIDHFRADSTACWHFIQFIIHNPEHFLVDNAGRLSEDTLRRLHKINRSDLDKADERKFVLDAINKELDYGKTYFNYHEVLEWLSKREEITSESKIMHLASSTGVLDGITWDQLRTPLINLDINPDYLAVSRLIHPEKYEISEREGKNFAICSSATELSENADLKKTWTT